MGPRQMTRVLHPVSLEFSGDGPNRRLQTAIPVERALADRASVSALLKCIETDYIITLHAARAALAEARQHRKRNVYAFWFAGKLIGDFLSRLSSRDLYLRRQNATLASHLSVSVSTLGRIMAFYRRHADPFGIDPSSTLSSRYSGPERR